MTFALTIGLFSSATAQATAPKARGGTASLGGEALLAPPRPEDGPVIVQASFEVYDINAIDEDTETFEFTGVLTLAWKDPRLAFDAKAEGVEDRIYQGDYQFNEISPSWFPQIVLVNQSGLFERDAVLLRVKSDGTCTLLQTVNAVAETNLDMGRCPFDSHRLEAVFAVLGFDESEVVLEAQSTPSNRITEISQWDLTGIEASTRRAGIGPDRLSSEFVVSIGVNRQSLFLMRMVVLPLAIIVVLSWAVFWMDRSSLGDRINVSFVGILTAVAYQLVIGDLLPHVSYITLIHGFLNLSLLIMCATVVVNLAVGACDKAGKLELGDRIDRHCRWSFPLAYLTLNLLMTGVAFLIT